jgi:A/G-specific adenine glycosylase
LTAAIARRLIDWFAAQARDLPWRRTRDPYAVWISEIMLQQTQVRTVIPYWERWMRELPEISALAEAKPERVLKLWEGLGYYRRARNLQQAARTLVGRHGGRFPETLEDVLDLPGIGRYTAGAICSIAFNQPVPALDGNVIRVLARVFGIQGNPRARRTNDLLWSLAAALVEAAQALSARQGRAAGRPKDAVPAYRDAGVIGFCSALNQSLMELGSVVCAPAQPQCKSCPLRQVCLARQEGLQDKLPQHAGRPRVTARQFIALVLEDRGRVLVQQRPADGVNAHLWEFPTFEVEAGDSVAILRAAANGFPVKECSLRALCTIKHSITRYRITVRAFHGLVGRSKVSKPPSGRWLTARQLASLPLTAAHRRILRSWQDERRVAPSSHDGPLGSADADERTRLTA